MVEGDWAGGRYPSLMPSQCLVLGGRQFLAGQSRNCRDRATRGKEQSIPYEIDAVFTPDLLSAQE
jgi:hypothetical protein